MKPKNRNPVLFFSALALWGVIILVSLLSFFNSAKESTASTPTTQVTATATSAWTALLEKTPFAYTTPLPDPAPSPLDGTYTKIDPSWPQWWLCRRCADYRPAGGIWKMQFDQGIMRIYYEVTGWMSIASFTVSADRLHLFNDPYCPEDTGVYTWKLEDGSLRLTVIGDACSFGLRGENLRHQSWLTCRPPEETTGASGQWPTQPGCDDNPAVPSTASSSNPQVTVIVRGGDSRFFEKPPDSLAYANSADTPSPEGISVIYHSDSIPFGLNRVLWWDGDWIEASSDLPFASMGVQFMGAPQIGWARVLFDGEEVWRGNTSAIWSERGLHGGYIEVSGYSQGMHTIRAESLGFDYRPVTVASFGFSYQDGVESGKP